ncbi:MAG: SPOR domain-containing protein [Asticcacaulis sp.]
MNDLAPFRKVLFLCAAVVITAGVSGCDSQNLKESLARIKDIQVDDTAKPADEASAKSLSAKDVDLVVKTAKDFTVGKDGLLAKGDGPIAHPKFTIAIVDPLKMPTANNAAPLETGVSTTPSVEQATAAPVTDSVRPQPEASKAVRQIQVGSFGSADAARTAWSGLLARYPGVEQYSPAYQTVTTADGKTMVRLKIGPVTSDGQAQSLCLQLDIRDNWCAKAG